MGYFPFFAAVDKLNIVVVGGGSVSLEKVERLLESDARLTVIAPFICEEIKRYKNRLVILEKEYEEADLAEADIIIAATDKRNVNEELFRYAKAHRILINVVDVPELCDFIFPSVLKRGKLVVGVSTSGASPVVGQKIRDRINEIIPADIEERLDFLAAERIRVKKEIQDPIERRRYLSELAKNVLADEE